MNLLDILKTAGTAVLSAVVPGAGAVISAVNALLPPGEQLPGNTTGTQISAALETLNPAQKSALLEKQFDVDIAQINAKQTALTAMLTNESTSTHTTRPAIALGAFYLLAFLSSSIILAWLYAVLEQDVPLVKAIVSGWPFVLGIIAPFTALLRAYFGILKGESRDRLDAAGGMKTGIVAGLLGK